MERKSSKIDSWNAEATVSNNEITSMNSN